MRMMPRAHGCAICWGLEKPSQRRRIARHSEMHRFGRKDVVPGEIRNATRLDYQSRRMPEPRIYRPLDLRSPGLSPRTGLYPLPPVGVGTGLIESLTSYITRLAQAHDVSTNTLLAKYLRFRFPRAKLTGTLETGEEWKRHFLEDAHTLNGMTERVSDWIFTLEESTGVGNLRYLTMAVWKGIFSSQGL